MAVEVDQGQLDCRFEQLADVKAAVRGDETVDRHLRLEQSHQLRDAWRELRRDRRQQVGRVSGSPEAVTRRLRRQAVGRRAVQSREHATCPTRCGEDTRRWIAGHQ
jgi:hypothetical protein